MRKAVRLILVLGTILGAGCNYRSFDVAVTNHARHPIDVKGNGDFLGTVPPGETLRFSLDAHILNWNAGYSYGPDTAQVTFTARDVVTSRALQSITLVLSSNTVGSVEFWENF